MFNGLAKFISKKWYVLLVVWVIVLIVAAPLSSLFFKSVSYSVTISIPGSTASKAENIVSNYFKLQGASSANGVLLLKGNASKYSLFLSNLTSYGNISLESFYTIEKSTLNASLSKIYPSALNLTKNFIKIANNETELYYNLSKNAEKLNSTIPKLENITNSTRLIESKFSEVKDNINTTTNEIEFLHNGMYKNLTSFEILKEGEVKVNSTAFNLTKLLFYPQVAFLKVWISVYDNESLPSYHNVAISNEIAYNYVSKELEEPEVKDFFNIFFKYWNSSYNYQKLSQFPENSSVPYIVADNSIYDASQIFFAQNSTTLNFVDFMLKYFNITNFNQENTFEDFTVNYVHTIYNVPISLAYTLYTTSPLDVVLNIYHEKTNISISLLKDILESNTTQQFSNISLTIILSKVNSTERQFIYQVFYNMSKTPYEFAVNYISYKANISPEIVGELANFTQPIQYINYISEKEANQTGLPVWFFTELIEDHNYSNLTAYLVAPKLAKLNYILERSNITAFNLALYLENATWEKTANISSLLIANFVNSTTLIHINNTKLYHTLYSMIYSNISLSTEINKLISQNTFPVELIQNITNGLFTNNYYIIAMKGNFTYKEAENFESYVENQTHLQPYLTGPKPVTHSLEGIANSAFSIAIPVGIALAIILAGIYFRSIVAAFAPLGTYLAAYLASSVLIWAIVVKILGITIDFLTPSQVLLLALGLGTDYVVFISSRYIEERKKGVSKDNAVEEAVKWGGRAVTITAFVVMLSFLFLYVYNVPFFSDTAIAEMLAVAVVWIASVTLFTSILAALGDKLFFPRKLSKREEKEGKGIRRAGLIVGVITAIVIISAVYAVTTPLTFNILDLLPPNQATEGVNLLSSQFTSDNVFPIYVVIPINSTFNESTYQYALSIYHQLSSIQGVTAVDSPVSPLGGVVSYNNLSEYNYTQYISHGYMLFLVNQKYQPFSDKAFNVVKNILSVIGNKGYVGGGPVDAFNILNFVNTDFAEIFLLITVTMYIILVIMTRSFSVAGVIIFTIMSAVAITLGLERLVFSSMGYSLFAIVPLFLVAIIIGIGMDYNIFLVARIHEELEKGNNMEKAVEITRSRIGKTIVFLGLIFAGTMGSLMLVNAAILQEIGFALAVAAILETSLLWYYLAPSLLILLYRKLKVKPKMLI
ncbi:MMPL family transporter [Acidianus brierleyi]|uniref:Antibiotic transporter n=1 Tax=Acidianus brierleyi TaxID=41673 RepID=A0A2U9IBD3_9CREN|nr:MMPL family transporter [Acidianus brierleyi]AWR93310.1 MMPL family transporter [Acidianus brierleyi]